MQRSVRNPLFRRGPSRHSFDPSPQAYPGRMAWDYDRIEIIADGIIHATGISLGLVGAIAIIIVAVDLPRTEITSIVIYILGLVAMLVISGAYNMTNKSPSDRSAAESTSSAKSAGDFRSLVEAVQRRGVRVTVVSTISTQPPMVAAELRRQADIFLDIVELQPKIGRDPAERAAREAREPRERHTPQFLQRPTAPQPAGAGAPLDDDDDFED